MLDVGCLDMGRIKLQEITNVDTNMDSDESIVESAKRYNAIVYTRDKRMHAIAMAKNVFYLT